MPARPGQPQKSHAPRHRDDRAVRELIDLSQNAPCKSRPDLFFPESGKRGDAALAKQICRGCPSRWRCLEHAIRHNERLGIWGGYTEKERRHIKSRQHLNALMQQESACPGCGYHHTVTGQHRQDCTLPDERRIEDLA